ncbi:MAG: hypothetical protein VX341_10590 [Bdellovibrionota bacterium]|nr:hypothetical protein [Bdellovibrionota bacterium]
MKIDKSSLSERLVEKQKMKGTYDSPCMSVCDYEGECFECQTCGMRKDEKQLWKISDQSQKSQLLVMIFKRRQN